MESNEIIGYFQKEMAELSNERSFWRVAFLVLANQNYRQDPKGFDNVDKYIDRILAGYDEHFPEDLKGRHRRF